METRCFLVPVCSLPCSRCLEDQQYGCVKSPGGTPLRHRQRMSSRWIPLFMVLQYTVYSDLILQWHPENPVGLFTSQTTRALDFVLLDQWPRISSGTGNIQTRDRLAFSIHYSFGVRVPTSLSTFQSSSLYSLFSKIIKLYIPLPKLLYGFCLLVDPKLKGKGIWTN